MQVKFKKLHPDAVLPTYAKPGDAGLDMTPVSKVWDKEKLGWLYGYGIAVEIPQGYAGFLYPRSSIWKKPSILSNHVGIVDSGYRGEIKALFRQTHDADQSTEKEYEIGERNLQMVIKPITHIEPEWADELSDTERGTGGFGSSGA